MLDSVLAGKVSRTVEKFNRLVPWHRLPAWLGRTPHSELRVARPFDARSVAADADVAEHHARVVAPTAPDATHADGPSEVMTPHPRVVSERLLARDAFVPATSLNVLAAAWIQFMTRDWFSHGEGEETRATKRSPEPRVPWPEHPMQVPHGRRDPARCPLASELPSFTNDVHWWDASQVYAGDARLQTRLRTLQDGKLKPADQGHLFRDDAEGPETGFITDTTWAPTRLLHTLFVREHNAICDALAAAYPSWDDDRLFSHARLINAALLAKIHTREWTSALLTQKSDAARWDGFWGAFGRKLRALHDPGADDTSCRSMEGAEHDCFGVPSALPAQFVSVYRMHSLVPDALILRSLRDAQLCRHATLTDLLGANGTRLIDELGMDDLLYSFGRAHPGALRLHNYPNLLRNLIRHDGSRIDLAALDVQRDRESGAPRYAAFRRLFQLPVPDSFEALTDQPLWARELAAVYEHVEQVDLLTGMLAEPLPEGMAFGETAFRVFMLMASRRLNADRVFTTDFTEEVYSPVGMGWIRDNGMTSVLLRHFPGLAPALADTKSAFWPWNAVRLS